MKNLLRASIGFVAWYLPERHAIMGAALFYGSRVSIFGQTKTDTET